VSPAAHVAESHGRRHLQRNSIPGLSRASNPWQPQGIFSIPGFGWGRNEPTQPVYPPNLSVRTRPGTFSCQALPCPLLNTPRAQRERFALKNMCASGSSTSRAGTDTGSNYLSPLPTNQPTNQLFSPPQAGVTGSNNQAQLARVLMYEYLSWLSVCLVGSVGLI
jgi:hypothetical protein